MLLTISQPPATEFGFRSINQPHDFAPRVTLPPPRVSPSPRIDSPVSSLRASANPPESKMSTPHRGLPPPSAMALPEPSRTGPPSLGPPLGSMPAPPSQWPGQEEAMRNWLAAKVEEDKRKQEEQKTQQETLRLEQRKIEQNMLRESLQGGISPNLIPVIYAAIGGANLASLSTELVQQYHGQLQAAHQQYHNSPDMSRETRLLGPGPGPPIYSLSHQQPQAQAQPQQAVLPSQPPEPLPPSGPMQTTFQAFPPATVRGAPTSAPRSVAHTQLPRLTTNEMAVPQQIPSQGSGLSHPLQQSQTLPPDQPSSSPSIYFHHWQPPNETKPSVRENPSTPASKGEPHHTHSSSIPSEGDFRDSPRKRKAQGGHQANPPPPSSTSPSFSTGSSASGRKTGHMRSRSNASAGQPDVDSRSSSHRREGGGRPHASSLSSYSMPRRRSDEQRQLPRRRSSSRPRNTSTRPSPRPSSADDTQEPRKEEPTSN